MTAALTLIDPDDEGAKPRLSFMHVTPEIASRWLKRNDRNRNLRAQTIARYARDMEAGKWHLDGTPIKFGPDGQLLDGQHRLAAIVKSGETILTAVATGIDPAAQAVMDTGRARTAADALSIDGEKNAHALAAAARLGLQAERGALNSPGEYSHEEIIAYIAANPDLRYACEFAMPLARGADCPPAVAVHSFMILSRLDTFEAARFWVGLSNGAGLEAGDPVLTLRNRFSEARRGKEKLGRHAYLSAIYRAWNYRREGKTLTMIKLNSPAVKGGLVPVPVPK